MPSNRFDFLELSEDPQDPAASAVQAVDPIQVPVAVPPPIQVSSTPRPRPNTPPRLAEVRVEDPRGYESILKAAEQTAENPWMGMGAVRTLKAAEIIGSRGDRAGQFNFPAGIAIDHAGILFVADSFNHRVQRITPDGGVSIIGTRGIQHTQFQNPMAVAVDERRAFYIVEQGNSRVQKFTSDGVLVLVVGELGLRPGQMRNPMGIAVSPITGEIVVADTGNSRVLRFDSTGKFVGMVGDRLNGQGLTSPQSVCCDRHGTIYVADTGGNRVTKYDPGGKPLGQFGGQPGYHSPVQSTVEIEEPHAVACGELGDLIIADGRESSGRINVVDIQTGSLHTSMTRASRSLGAFAKPCGVGVAPRSVSKDSRGDVYVSDTLNHRIIRFAWQ